MSVNDVRERIVAKRAGVDFDLLSATAAQLRERLIEVLRGEYNKQHDAKRDALFKAIFNGVADNKCQFTCSSSDLPASHIDAIKEALDEALAVEASAMSTMRLGDFVAFSRGAVGPGSGQSPLLAAMERQRKAYEALATHWAARGDEGLVDM